MGMLDKYTKKSSASLRGFVKNLEQQFKLGGKASQDFYRSINPEKIFRELKLNLEENVEKLKVFGKAYAKFARELGTPIKLPAELGKFLRDINELINKSKDGVKSTHNWRAAIETLMERGIKKFSTQIEALTKKSREYEKALNGVSTETAISTEELEKQIKQIEKSAEAMDTLHKKISYLKALKEDLREEKGGVFLQEAVKAVESKALPTPPPPPQKIYRSKLIPPEPHLYKTSKMAEVLKEAGMLLPPHITGEKGLMGVRGFAPTGKKKMQFGPKAFETIREGVMRKPYGWTPLPAAPAAYKYLGGPSLKEAVEKGEGGLRRRPLSEVFEAVERRIRSMSEVMGKVDILKALDVPVEGPTKLGKYTGGLTSGMKFSRFLRGTGVEGESPEEMAGRKRGTIMGVASRAFRKATGISAFEKKEEGFKKRIKEEGAMGVAGAVAGKGALLFGKAVVHMGKKGFEKSMKALGAVGKAFKSGAMAPIEGFVGMIKNLASAFQPFKIILEPISKIIGSLGSIMGAELAPALGDLIKAFFNEKTIGMVTTLGEAFLPLIKIFAKIMGSDAVMDVLDAVVTIITNVLGILTDESEGMSILETILTGLAEVVAILLPMLEPVIEGIMAIFLGIGNMITTVFKNPAVQSALDSLFETLGMLMNAIADIFNDPAVQEAVALIVENLVGMIENFFKVLKPILPPLIKVLVFVVSAIVGFMRIISDFVAFITLGFVRMEVPGEGSKMSSPTVHENIAGFGDAFELQKQAIIVKSGVAKVHAGEAVVKKELISEIFKEMTVTNNFYGTPDHYIRNDFSNRMKRLWRD